MFDGNYEYIEYTPKQGAGESVRERLFGKGELIGFYKRTQNNSTYYRIKFYDCGHECFIRAGKVLECNNKDCVSKRMSAKRKIIFNTPEYKAKMSGISKNAQSREDVKEKHRQFFSEYWGKEENRQSQSKKKLEYFTDADNRKAQSERTKKYFTNTENRERVSKSVKNVYSNREYKQKYLEKRAEVERAKQNSDEMFFKNILEHLGIDYVWQVPLLTDYGKGFVFDFYIPCADVYINIDGSIHGTDFKYASKYVEQKKANDEALDDYCRTHNINFCHITVSTLHSANFNLKEVIDL